MIGAAQNLTAQETDRRRISEYSILRSSPIFLVLAIVIACGNNMADPDLWMHILGGEQIIRTGHVAMRDIYSYSAAGLPWRDHEWLAQVILALAYNALGVFGLRVVKLICIAVTMCALAVGLSWTAAAPRVQRLVLLACALGMVGQVQFRPQLFTYPMLSVLMATLAIETYGGRARLWPLIPLFILWANLHGGYAAGLAALVVFSVLSALREWHGKTTITRAWTLTCVSVACALATLVNPSGIGLWGNIIHSVSDPIIRSNVDEWRSLPIAIASQWDLSLLDKLKWLMPLGLYCGFLAAMVIAPVADDLELAAIALGFIGAAFYAYRNVALAIVALSIPFAHHIGVALQRRASPSRVRPQMEPGTIFVGLAAIALALARGEFSNRLRTWDEVPNGAVAFMKANGLRGNILNDYGWGAYLVWHAAPDSKVFIDGRCELVYPDYLIRKYFHFLNAQPGGRSVLDEYPHDFVLVGPRSGAYGIVANDSRWKLIYRDEVSALFAKASGHRGNLAVKTANGEDGPSFFP